MYFSFIIPCYNEQEDISNTIDSCLGQDYAGEFEILIIDDGSKDNTLSIVNDYMDKNKKVRVLTYEGNRGVSFARNYGVKNALGEVMIFLNADEIPPSNFLSSIEKYFIKGADYFFPQTEVINKDTSYGIFREAYRKYKYSTPNSFLWSQGFACRKSVFEKIGGFNINYPGCGGEDWDLVIRIEDLCLNRVVDLSVVVRHRVPQGLRNVIWHIYNRGRGSAYFDLIKRKKKPKSDAIKLILSLLILILFSLWDLNIISFILLFFLYRHLIHSYKMAKKINAVNKMHHIAILGLFDRIIRNIGYYNTTIRFNSNRKMSSV